MLIIVILTIIVFSAAALLSNLPLTVRHEDLGGELKIAHISDLHKRRFGKDNARLVELTAAQKPDVIVVTGDIVSRTQTDFSAVKSAIEGLCGIAPVYMIFGNHEQSLPQNRKREFLEIVSETNAVMLRNSFAEADIGGRKLTFAGLEESYDTYKKNDSYRGLDKVTVGELNDLLGECPKGEVILLAHNPFFGEAYSQWGAAFTMSGHVHGGAVRLFGVGLLSPERRFFPRNSKGVYTFGKMKLLVSAGLGKLRLFDPPEIVIYKV